MTKSFSHCLLSILLFASSFCFAAKEDTLKKDKGRLIGFPVLSYTPETNFAFGAAGIYSFRLHPDSAHMRPSTLQLGFVYTLKNQVVFQLPFQLWLNKERNNIYGELGYYRYNFDYWGIGANRPDSAKENYSVTFPRIRLSALREVLPHFYTGVRYGMDQFEFTEKDPNKELVKNTITGSTDGRVSSIGITAKYDNRDNVFYPGKGLLAEFYVQTDQVWTGSDYQFMKYSFDASTYFTNRFHHILALNFYSVMETGDPPFNQMATLGGAKKARGYYEGRFRDKDLILIQAEYRVHLFWRVGAVVFAGYGGLADSPNHFQLDEFKYNYGGGMRFQLDQKQNIHIRLDYGRGEKTDNFYFTLGEAF